MQHRVAAVGLGGRQLEQDDRRALGHAHHLQLQAVQLAGALRAFLAFDPGRRIAHHALDVSPAACPVLDRTSGSWPGMAM
jgi:hypothetical protein